VDQPIASSPTGVAPAAPPYDTRPYARDEMLHEVFAATAAIHPDRLAVRLAEPDPDSSRRSELT
jgi:hypothetical protein